MARSDKWGQCKIEAADNVKSKVEVEGSIKKALIAVSSESGIPVGTLKRWVYPKTQKKYEGKRPKRKTVAVSDSDTGSKPDTEHDTGNIAVLEMWEKDMTKRLKIASGILDGLFVLGSNEERAIVKACFGKIDTFLRLYIEKRRNKDLPF